MDTVCLSSTLLFRSFSNFSVHGCNIFQTTFVNTPKKFEVLSYPQAAPLKYYNVARYFLFELDMPPNHRNSFIYQSESKKESLFSTKSGYKKSFHKNESFPCYTIYVFLFFKISFNVVIRNNFLFKSVSSGFL